MQKRGAYARRDSKEKRPRYDGNWSIEDFKTACDTALAERGIRTRKAGAATHRPWGRLPC